MSNQIRIHIEFSWQGETYCPAAVVDLERIMADKAQLPDLHQLLAQLNGIDSYSYQYEVLCAHEIVFSEASGLAADFLHDGHFDFSGFATAWQEAQLQRLLGRVARQYLQIDDLDSQPALQQALRAAWQLGHDHP